MNKKILIFVTHPDDDILTFSGLIIKSLKNGDHVKVHVLTYGGPCSNVSSEVRLAEFKSAMNFLGVTDYSYSGENLDGLLSTIPNSELTSLMDKMIEDFKPDEVYCNDTSEHKDHQATYDAFLAASRVKSGFMPKLFAVGTYVFSNQLYPHPLGGKIYNPLTKEELDMKCEAFKLHKSQLKPEPSLLGVDSIITEAEYNGMMCGEKYAELYYQLKYKKSKSVS